MALLVRMFEGKLSNENRTPRWGDYYIKGQAMGLTTVATSTAFDAEVSRKEMAIYLYRLKTIVSDPSLKATSLNKISTL